MLSDNNFILYHIAFREKSLNKNIYYSWRRYKYTKRCATRCNDKWEIYVSNLVKIIIIYRSRNWVGRNWDIIGAIWISRVCSCCLALNAVTMTETSTRPNIAQSYRRNVTVEFQWNSWLGSRSCVCYEGLVEHPLSAKTSQTRFLPITLII